MKTKEIEEAMELFEKVRVNSGVCAYITKKDVKKAEMLSEYIKRLEKMENKAKKLLDEQYSLYNSERQKEFSQEVIDTLEEVLEN